jgi:hypothetical protein
MKGFMCLAGALMIILMFIGCASMSSEERKETYDLRKSVGDSPFVGSMSPDAVRSHHEVFAY